MLKKATAMVMYVSSGVNVQLDVGSTKRKNGALGRTRTSNRLVRSQVLYPVELRVRSQDMTGTGYTALKWRTREDSNLQPPGS